MLFPGLISRCRIGFGLYSKAEYCTPAPFSVALSPKWHLERAEETPSQICQTYSSDTVLDSDQWTARMRFGSGHLFIRSALEIPIFAEFCKSFKFTLVTADIADVIKNVRMSESL